MRHISGRWNTPILPFSPDDSLLVRPANPTLAMLKRYEDRLDALTCAYVAAYYLRWGAERVQVLGDTMTGHIVVPRMPLTQEPAPPVETL